jgi:predicted dehydrogenase
MNIATHLIDQAVLLLGADTMPRVLCRMDIANSFGDAENYVKIILTAPGKPLVDIEASSCCACPPPRYSVQGLHGGLTGGSHRMSWKYYKPEEAPPRQLIREPLSDAQGNPTFCAENLRWYEETWEDDRDEYDVAPREYYESLHLSWTGGAPFEVDAAQVGMQMEIVEECMKAQSIVSASTG